MDSIHWIPHSCKQIAQKQFVINVCPHKIYNFPPKTYICPNKIYNFSVQSEISENALQVKNAPKVVTIIRNFHNSFNLSVHLSLCTNAERKETHLGANCNYGQNIPNIGRIDYGRIGEYCFVNIKYWIQCIQYIPNIWRIDYRRVGGYCCQSVAFCETKWEVLLDPGNLSSPFVQRL